MFKRFNEFKRLGSDFRFWIFEPFEFKFKSLCWFNSLRWSNGLRLIDSQDDEYTIIPVWGDVLINRHWFNSLRWSNGLRLINSQDDEYLITPAG